VRQWSLPSWWDLLAFYAVRIYDGNLRNNIALYCCNLDLDPMTLIYELDLHFRKMYLHVNNKLSSSVISKVIVTRTRIHTNIQTDAWCELTCCYMSRCTPWTQNVHIFCFAVVSTSIGQFLSNLAHSILNKFATQGYWYVHFTSMLGKLICGFGTILADLLRFAPSKRC